ncbi:hypothetical protein H9P43_008320 [Blastocladiella emersonii ATCC 22665]|nr:hypothetical protein H9P43_008320 [Blastocladiella emersonii ATCC 22665]
MDLSLDPTASTAALGLVADRAAASADPRRLLRRLRAGHLGAWELLAAAALAAGAVGVAYVAVRAVRALLASSSSASPADADGDGEQSAKGKLPSSGPIRITMTLRNTALWSPSSDPTAPNYAFAEGAKAVLVRHLAAHPRIELHLVAAVASPAERAEVTRLLTAASIHALVPSDRIHLLSPPTSPPAAGPLPGHLAAQLACVRAIRPHVHIEGSRCTRLLQELAGAVPAVVWVYPRLARSLASKRGCVDSALGHTPPRSRAASASSSVSSLAAAEEQQQQLPLTPSSLFAATATSGSVPPVSGSGGVTRTPSWSDGESASSDTGSALAPGAPSVESLVADGMLANVVVAARLAEWCDPQSPLGAQVAAFGLAP